MSLTIFIPLSLAEDYPASYIGPGYRQYLKDKSMNGYYVKVFLDLEGRQKENVEKRNQVEGVVNTSYQANSLSSRGILETNYEIKNNNDEFGKAIKEEQGRVTQVASAQGAFSYVKYSDGKTVYSQDGLTSSIENERLVDEFGNLSLKNTYAMQYDENRLLTSYEAEIKDNLGNISRIYTSGIKYSPGSVFYGGADKEAPKNETEKYIQEIDSAGNIRVSHWKALSYAGNLLSSFIQEEDDSVYGTSSFTRTNITYEDGNYRRIRSYQEYGRGTDGLEYTQERTNITYNDNDAITGYEEKTTTIQLDGGQVTTITEANFKYLPTLTKFGEDVEEPEPDKLLESTITTTTLHTDGSKKDETVTTTYKYDKNQSLVSALADSTITGQDANWFEYRDTAGHSLTRAESEFGTVYSYLDPDTLETVNISEDKVIATLKEGNKYSGTSETQYEVLFGKPMAKRLDSIICYYGHNIAANELIRIETSNIDYTNALVNNIHRLLGTKEQTNITFPLTDPQNTHGETTTIATTYFYDEKGNLLNAEGRGQKKGYEYQDTRGWYGKYSAAIDIDYEVIFGKAERTVYNEEKNYGGGE